LRFLSFLLDLIYPPRCVFCRAPVKRSGEICQSCANSLPYTNNSGKQSGDFYSVCVSPLFYEDDVRESLLRYKFSEATGYATVYGKYIAESVRTELLDRYDIISWVPLSRKRLRKRGYDQAKLLAKALARELGCKAEPVLRKVKDVKKQSQMGGAEKRKANISGAYQVKRNALVKNKRILLVDDIITTGSTISECAKTLRIAGAADIVCATLARSRD